MHKDTISDDLQIENQVLHPGTRLCLRNWETLRGSKPCPDRSQFSLRPLSTIAPQLFVAEYEPQNDRFIYRLAGSGLSIFNGGDPTGKDVLNGWGQFERQVLLKTLMISIVHLQPAMARISYPTFDGQQVGTELVALPYRVGEAYQLIGGQFSFTKLSSQDLRPAKRELLTARTISTEYAPIGRIPVGYAWNRVNGVQLRVIQGGRVKGD